MSRYGRWLIGATLVLLVAGCNMFSNPQIGGGGDPIAWIDQPLDGSSFPVGSVPVLIHASGPTGISAIRLDVNGKTLQSSAPDSTQGGLAQVQFSWNPSTPGNYTLQAYASGAYNLWGPPAQAVVSITGAKTPQVATMSSQCTFTAASDLDIYMRPSLSADVFSHVSAGFSAQIQAQTSDGWLGFDPGVAQAANTGPFRLRWIPPNTAATTGDCSGLPQVWGPPPGVCFLMPMAKINLYTQPDKNAAVSTTIGPDQYATVDGINPNGWASVEQAPGTSGSFFSGWVAPEDININGPCDFPAASPTMAPTSTSTPGPTLSVQGTPPSTNSIYFGSGSCSPFNVTFGAQASDSSAVKAMVFFYRLKDSSTGKTTNWSSGQAMNPDGAGHYTLSLSGRQLDGGTGYKKATVEYQFALQPKQGQIVRSQVYTDVQLLRCGTIIAPPPVTIKTPTPTLINIVPIPIPINTPTVPVIR